MTRIRQPDQASSLEADDDIRTLMADIDASMADLEQRLAEASARGRKAAPAAPPPAAEVPPPAPPAAAASTAPELPLGGGFESSLLAELAQEEQAKLGTGGASAQERRARAMLLHETLDRIFRFLNQFARQANNIEPRVNRTYRLDMHTAFTDLKWKGAFADYRKQDLSEKALLSHVGFRVRLVAPAPVAVTRRWDQVDDLKKEMHILDLRTVEGHDPIGSPLQEHMQVNLAPDFPVQIRFRANYDHGRIDVLARNIEGFGIAAFELDPMDVTQALLDGLGRFLIFRADNLPPALRRVQFLREPTE